MANTFLNKLKVLEKKISLTKIICVLSIGLCSCSQDTLDESHFQTIQPLKKDLSSRFETFSLSVKAVIKPDNQAQIGMIDQVYLDEERLLILDEVVAKDIFVFGLDGTLFHKIKVNGVGVGEFTEVQSFFIETKSSQLIVLTGNPSKLIYFDLEEGTFLKESKINPEIENIAFFDNGSMVSEWSLKGDKVIQISQNDTLLLSCVSTNYWKYDFRPWQNGLMKDGNGFSYLPPNNNILYSITTNTCQEKYKLDLGDASPIDASGKAKEIYDQTTAMNLRHFLNDKYILFNYQIQGSSYSTLLNREDGSIETVKISSVNTENFMSFLLTYACGSTKDGFLVFLNPSELETLASLVRSTTSRKTIDRYSELINWAKVSQESDNPLIVEISIQ